MTLLENLPHYCDGYKRTRTLDAHGGSTDSYTRIFADRKCWRQAVRDAEINEFSKRGIQITDKVYFSSVQSLTEVHQLDFDGIRFDVMSTAVPDSSVGLGYLWRVMVQAATTESAVL